MITYNECLKKLVDLGKESGYITFKQINDILPNSPFFLDKVDDIILTLSSDGIEIIDETEKRITKGGAVVPRLGKHREFKSKQSYGNQLRMYLFDMKNTPLADREGIMRAVRRIRELQMSILHNALRSGSSLREMYHLLHRYQQNKVPFKDIFKVGFSTHIDIKRERKTIRQFKKILHENETHFEKIGDILDNCVFDETGTANRQKEIDDIRNLIVNTYKQFNFNDKLIKRLIYRIRDLSEHIVESYDSIAELTKIKRYTIDEICTYGRRARKGDPDFSEVEAETGMDPNIFIDTLYDIKEARRNIRLVELETKMTGSELVYILREIERLEFYKEKPKNELLGFRIRKLQRDIKELERTLINDPLNMELMKQKEKLISIFLSMTSKFVKRNLFSPARSMDDYL